MQTAMTNLADGDNRLWVHLISVYVISWYIYKVSISVCTLTARLSFGHMQDSHPDHCLRQQCTSGICVMWGLGFQPVTRLLSTIQLIQIPLPQLSMTAAATTFNVHCGQACCLAPHSLSHCSCLQLLWRFNKEAVALRIQYLMKTKEGAESHTVLVTDIPVLEFGTIPHRIETTVFRYLPVRVKVGRTACTACSHSGDASSCAHSQNGATNHSEGL